MRPQFHFTARGWINDPHGVTFSNGRYHSFFQYAADRTAWSLDCSWGHATGADLFSLSEGPTALEPGEGDDGIWTGSLIVADDGTPRIFYTSISAQHPALGSIRTATPVDGEWSSWRKGPTIIEPSPARLDHFRDPIVIRDGSGWRMLVGAGLSDGSAAVMGYRSDDLSHWEDTGPVTARRADERDPVWSGSMWECPQLIEVGGQHALVVSVWHEDALYDVVYALGAYSGGVFSPRTWGRLSYGTSLYAATAFRDGQGEPGLLFWLRGIAGEHWAGAHSIPYRVSVVGDRLSLSPHPDLERYHDTTDWSGSAVDLLWPALAGDTAAIRTAGRDLVTLERDGGDLLVQSGDDHHTIPWADDLRVIFDGPIMEICSAAGVFACAIRPLEGDWELIGDGVSVRGLRRSL